MWHRPWYVFITEASGIHPNHKAITDIVVNGVFCARLPKWDEVPGGERLADTAPHEIQRLFFGHCRMEAPWDRFDFVVDVTPVSPSTRRDDDCSPPRRIAMAKANAHRWEFRARFRRHAFGWKSQPAIKRIKEAVSEIKKVARTDKVLAAEGAVLFLEKLSPALEHVDSSSGAIGTAVNNAIAKLVPVIASAPAEAKTREAWLERLWDAYQDDEIPYLELLGDYWGELYASREAASRWADELIGSCKMACSPDPNLRGSSATSNRLRSCSPPRRAWAGRTASIRGICCFGVSASCLVGKRPAPQVPPEQRGNPR